MYITLFYRKTVSPWWIILATYVQFDDRLPYLEFICLHWLPAHNIPNLHHPEKTKKVSMLQNSL